MRPLINCWSSLSHASHCVTTSWPAAATQTRVRVSPARHPKVFFMLDALPVATIPILGLEDPLRICWRAHPEARLMSITWRIMIRLFAVWQAEMESQLRMQQEQLKKQREEQLKAMQRQLEVCCLSNIFLFINWYMTLSSLTSDSLYRAIE